MIPELEDPIDPKEVFNDLIVRMKNTKLSWFEVERKIESNWLPKGTVPFDISASNGIAKFKVYASSKEDAEDQVSRYLDNDD
jgi:hypothetical protein